ncbi:M64 family metallopeptidase [Demequina pelophila]|uniref:M64 family metallopeptidase n=1 Tax=Demequina pelophila TaxID=1638984 RepID=UPI0007819A70|nr:M64 family metallopeptidase [Demequina pelophila]
MPVPFRRVLAGLAVAALAGCAGTSTTAPDGASPTPGTGASALPSASSVASPTPGDDAMAGRSGDVPEGPAPDGLEALVPGNNVDADRINLILAGDGFPSDEEFRAIAEQYVGWDGTAQPIDLDGRVAADPGDAVMAEVGLFGIDPYRSSRDLFNVWIAYDAPIPEGLPSFNNATAEQEPFDLPHQSIVLLRAGDLGDLTTSVSGIDNAWVGVEEPADAGEDPFANSFVSLDLSYPVADQRLIAHELGHALFGLLDEYIGEDGIPGNEGRPSLWPVCAQDRETAEAWWGDLVGEVDPAIETYLDAMAEAGFPVSEDMAAEMREQVTVGYVDNGCYGDEGTYRPTQESLMNHNFPALGAVNRRHAENVLALFSGGLD